MEILTPEQLADKASNKYLGVLVAAKFARFVNDFPRDRAMEEKKLTTVSLEALTKGELGYKLVSHRRPNT